MMIRFVCPLGHRLTVPSHRAGKKGRCPVCNEKVVVPVPNPRADGTDAPEEDGAADEEGVPPQASGPAPAAFPVPSTPSPAAAGPVSHPSQPAATFAAPGAPTIPGLGFRPGPARAAHAAPGKISAGPSASAPPTMPSLPQQPAAMYPPAMAPAPVAQVPAAQVPAATPSPKPFESIPEIKHLEAPGPEYSAVPTPLPNVRLGTVASNALKANKGKTQTVYMLGVGLSLVVLASALPALGHLNLVEAPGWARGVFLLAALQLVYVAWMMALPDWSTVWVGMWLFAVVAALYAMVLMIVTFTAPGKPMMLSLYDVQQTAKGWSAIMMLLMGLMSYMCGRVSMSWRKAFELAKAKRPSGATR